jgi:type II secretory pathway pseudopilin PulG
MAGKVRAWVWIVIAIVVLGILGVIAMAAAGLWFVKSHVNIQSATTAVASADFQTIRARFANQKPLIELDERGNFLQANTDRPAGTQRPQTLTILAFDSHDEKVVRLELPFWLLRLKGGGSRFDIGGGNVDLAKLRLTVEDLERFGPTLILDQKDNDGSRVLIWSQ